MHSFMLEFYKSNWIKHDSYVYEDMLNYPYTLSENEAPSVYLLAP